MPRRKTIECDVAVYGGGHAGALLVKRLAGTADVVLVDPNDFFEVSSSIVRSLVEPGFAKDATISYAEAFPNVRFVHGRLVRLGGNGDGEVVCAAATGTRSDGERRRSGDGPRDEADAAGAAGAASTADADLSGDDLSGDDLSGDDLSGDDLSGDEEEEGGPSAATQRVRVRAKVVVLATGARYRTEATRSTRETTRADRLAFYEKYAERVAAARSILVAGGGPIGVEFAAEVLDAHGAAKKVTIVNGAPRLLATSSERASRVAETHLVEHGARVLNNTSVELPDDWTLLGPGRAKLSRKPSKKASRSSSAGRRSSSSASRSSSGSRSSSAGGSRRASDTASAGASRRGSNNAISSDAGSGGDPGSESGNAAGTAAGTATDNSTSSGGGPSPGGAGGASSGCSVSISNRTGGDAKLPEPQDEELEYDLLLPATGGRPISEYMEAEWSAVLNAQREVRVDADLTVNRAAASRAATSLVFAFGDVAALDEPKLAWLVGGQIDVVAANVRERLRGGAAFRKYANHPGDPRMGVTLGKDNGVFEVPYVGTICWGWFARRAKSRTMMVPKFRHDLGV